MHHPDLHRDQAHGVAIGCRLRDRGMSYYATASGAVDHVDGLTELLLEQRADDASGGVGAATGAPRHDKRDRSLRICGEYADGEERERRRSEASRKRLDHDFPP